jgi:hypothetical protein
MRGFDILDGMSGVGELAGCCFVASWFCEYFSCALAIDRI